MKDLQLGDTVAFEKDGVIVTEKVTRMSYTSAQPEIVRRLSWWQRIVRRLTPKRFRKSLVVQEYKPAEMTVGVGEDETPIDRHLKMLSEVEKMIGGFTSPAGVGVGEHKEEKP